MTERIITPVHPFYLDKPSAALYVSSSPRQLDYARAKKELPFYRLPGKVLYSRDDLDAWMSRFKVEAHEGSEGMVSE